MLKCRSCERKERESGSDYVIWKREGIGGESTKGENIIIMTIVSHAQHNKKHPHITIPLLPRAAAAGSNVEEEGARMHMDTRVRSGEGRASDSEVLSRNNCSPQ